MKIIIVGGGKVGRYLLTELLQKGHDLTLIEQKKNKCDKIRQNFNGVRVVCGDGSEAEVLEKAGIAETDVVLAVTKDDQDNLVICQLAERQFNIPSTFTTVNTPGNERLFDWLGVNVAISSPAILLALVDQEMAMTDLEELLSQKHDELELVRFYVEEDSPAAGKKLKELELPLEVVLVSLLRGDTPIVPRGNTRIYQGDLVVVLTREGYKESLYKMFE